MEELSDTLPEWQKRLISDRLEAITKNPGRLRRIEELFEELDTEENQ